MKLIQQIRSVLSFIFHGIYWKIFNIKSGSRFYNSEVSRKVILAKNVMRRSHTEIGVDFSLGDYSYISSQVTHIESAHIGKFYSITRQTIIGIGGHNYNWVTTHPILSAKEYNIITDKPSPQKAPPKIGNDVWVGINSIIFRGVTIGDGAVIAAGSVVTKDVEPYSIVGGVPAKHIRCRFDKEIIQKLLEIKWWDWDINKIKEESAYMYDIDLFLERNY